MQTSLRQALASASQPKIDPSSYCLFDLDQAMLRFVNDLKENLSFSNLCVLEADKIYAARISRAMKNYKYLASQIK